MIDKHRHRHDHAPQGFLPNWVLVAFAAASIVVIRLAHSLI
jgi:hypothetical protein